MRCEARRRTSGEPSGERPVSLRHGRLASAIARVQIPDGPGFSHCRFAHANSKLLLDVERELDAIQRAETELVERGLWTQRVISSVSRKHPFERSPFERLSTRRRWARAPAPHGRAHPARVRDDGGLGLLR